MAASSSAGPGRPWYLSDAVQVVDFGCDSEAAAERSRESPQIFIGVDHHGRSPGEGVDVLLTTDPQAASPYVVVADLDSALCELRAAVQKNAAAAIVLVQTLRAMEHLDAARSLFMESLTYAMLQSGPEHASWLAARKRRERPPVRGASVLLERSDTSLCITLDRPDARNALDASMRDELIAGLDVAVADATIKQVHLRGRGSNFSAGGDLSEFGTRPDPVTGHLVRTRSRLPWMLLACADRLVAHTHGASAGAGVELAAFAAHVTADRSATFCLPELSFGLIPGAGGTVSVPARIGRHRAAFLMLTGRRIDARTAHAWGLVDEIIAA